MKTLRFLFCACFAFALQSSFGQQIISNFNSGVGFPHLLLSETSLNDYARITFRNTASPGNDFWDVAGVAAGAAGAKFNIYYHNGTTGADILSVDGPTQRVGIGTINPLTRFSISPYAVESKITLWDGGNAANHYGFGVSSLQLNYHVDAAVASHVFYAGGKNGNGTELMRIRGNGNVGIGTASPAFKLDVIGDAKFSNIRDVYQIQSSSDLEFTIDKTNNSALFGFFEVFNGVGNHLLWVNEAGNAYIRGNTGIGGNPTSSRLFVNGVASKPGGGVWTTSSDARLKQDVTEYTDGLDKILKINPVTFKYNGKAGIDSKETYVGIIAQEIQEVAPYTVSNYIYEDDKGAKEEYLQFDGTALTYMLINAVQEQNQMIEKKNKENQELKIQVNRLEERMAKLEALLSKGSTSNISLPSNTQQDVFLNGANQARLLQNAPNPFKTQTTVKYFLPNNTTDAFLRISDQAGRVLKNIKLEGTGEGQVNINAQELPVGTYTYTLLIGSKPVDVKQMVLTQ